MVTTTDNWRKMKVGQTVRFKRNSRFADEYRKGDLGLIEEVLATRPDNQNNVYVVNRLWRDKIMPNIWATDEDVEAFDQLRLF